MNKSDLTKLQKFVSDKEIPGYEALTKMYENNNLYATCNNYTLGVIFKDVNNKDYYKYRDTSKLDLFEGLIKMLGQYIEDYESYFVVNRKQLLNDLKKKFKEFKIKMRDEHATFIHKKDVRLTLSLYLDNYELYYSLANGGVNDNSSKVSIDCKDEQHGSTFNIIVNLQYFMEYLNFFKDDLLTIKYSSDISPLVSETEDRATLLLPIRRNSL